jgi:hypothetical protein
VTRRRPVAGAARLSSASNLEAESQCAAPVKTMNTQTSKRFRPKAGVCLVVGILMLGPGLNRLALAQDPMITLQPTNQIVVVGRNVTMTVGATTTNGPLSYQWQRDDPTAPATFTNHPNGQLARISLRNVTFEQAGDYRVIVANAGGDSVTSDVAHLEIVEPPFTKITQGAVVTNRANFINCAFADMNDDGFSDLLVVAGADVRHQAPVLYRNEGGTHFVQLTADQVGEAVTPNGGWFYQGLWADFDNDDFSIFWRWAINS